MRAWLLLLALAFAGWTWPAQRAQAFSPVSGCQAQDATHFVCSSISAMSAQLDAMPDATGTCSPTTGDKQWHTVIFWNYPASGTVKVSGSKVQRCGSVPVPPSGYDYQIGLASSSSNCPTGSVFNENGKTCVDRTACLARNADLPQTNAIAVGGTVCKDGCEYGPIQPGVDVAIPGTTTQYLRSGQLGYTGNTCTAPQPPPSFDPKTQKDACTPAGTFTFCLKPDGRHCLSASTGKQLCWQPGETGEKNADNVRQKRDPGTTTNPPTPLNNGDTLTKTGDSLQTNTTTNGRTITTNTTNYITGSGSNSGPDDSTPSDSDKGSASGGEGCDTPPVCSGDAINCAILHQAWLDRCGGNNHKVGGGTCGTDGAVAGYTCSGDEILCAANLHALEQKCMAEATGNSLGTGDGLGDFDRTDDGHVKTANGNTLTDRLDSTGFLSGTRTCVHFPPLDLGTFGVFDLESQPWLCDFQAFIRATLRLLGGFIALMLLIKGHG